MDRSQRSHLSMSGRYSADRPGPSILKPTVSEYSSRCGTRIGVTESLSLSRTGMPAASGSSEILPKATSWSHGPLDDRNSRMRGIAQTGTPRAPMASWPRCISPV